MKKIALLFSIAAVVTTLCGCSANGNSASESNTQDSVVVLVSDVEADTLARSLGLIYGSEVNNEKQQMLQLDSVMNTYADSSYLRGFETAMGADIQACGYTQGVRAAREIIFKIEELKSYGIDINREMLLAAFERQFAADTITTAQLQTLNQTYNQLLKQIYNQSTQ